MTWPAQWRALVEGFVVGISNPKAIAFFVAILPQYADPGIGTVGLQMAVLGAVFAAIALVLDSGWALGSRECASMAGAFAGATRAAAPNRGRHDGRTRRPPGHDRTPDSLTAPSSAEAGSA